MKIFTKTEIEAYNDEDRFTQEVIMPLFSLVLEMSGISKNGACKVEYWGKNKIQEGQYGIDVYCGYYDHLHKTKHIAIQCKVGNITMGSNSSRTSSIETIENQIKKAYRAQFTSPLDHKSSTKIDGFYLITSGTINVTARDFFRNLPFTNIDCIDCDELIYLIKKYSAEDQRLIVEEK